MADPTLRSAVPVLERRVPIKRRPPRRRAIVRWAKRVVLGGGLLAVVVALVRAWMPAPLVVDTAAIARGPLEVGIDEDGRTRVRQRFVVSAPISGELERVELEAGAEVTAGAVLARIRPPRPPLLDERSRGEATARLAAANVAERRAVGAIARAKLARDAAVHDAERARRLEHQRAITTVERERTDLAERLAIEDFATAALQQRSARAEIEAARAVLFAAPGKREPSIIEIAAPSTGKILRVLRDSAGPIAAGTPIFELGDVAGIEVVIDVLSRDAAHVSPNMEVRISPDGETSFAGKVRLVEPAAFTRVSALGVEEQRVNLIAAFDRPPPNLGDGFRVDATIITWRGAAVLLAPGSTLFRDRGQWALYVVEDGRARLRHVEIGHRGRLDVEVTSGLEPGALAIVHPSDRVVDGAKVQPR